MGPLGEQVIRIGERATTRDESNRDIVLLYMAHGPRAKRLAYLLTGDWSVAEELAQEAFVRLMGRFGHLRKPEASDIYLRRIVINLANSHLRRTRLERTHRHSSDRTRVATTELPDVETRDELVAAVQQLPPRQRAAVVLRYCEDLSEHEVAAIMRTSEKAVRSLAGRGLGNLRKALEGGTE
jgi:RNA polymerase sigma-70 factor (sigma-E family)